MTNLAPAFSALMLLLLLTGCGDTKPTEEKDEQPKIPQLPLFHLKANPEELNDLSVQQPERVDKLFAGLVELPLEMEDTLVLKLDHYR